MARRRRSRKEMLGRILLFGIGLSLLYGAIDVLVDYAFFKNASIGAESIIDEVLSPSAFEIYERSFVFLLLTGFAIYMELSTVRLRRARQALVVSEKRIRGITAALGDGVYVLEKGGRLTFMNPAAERLWGWTEAELQGRNIHNIVHSRHVDNSPYPVDECPVLQVFETGATYRTADDAYVRKDGTIFPASYVTTPLRQNGAVTAVVTIFQDITVRKQADALSQSLDEINELIHSTLDFEQIMQQVKVEAARAIGCEAAAITLRHEDHWVMRYVYGFPEKFVGRDLSLADAPQLALCAASMQPVIADEARTDPRTAGPLINEMGIRSLLGVPLMVRREVTGNICFAYLGKETSFTGPQIDFAVKVAASVSLALENARLYDDERHVAQTLQQAILTLPDKLPGVEIGHLYRSATEIAEVGGDFYDLFPLEHDRVGITIGDISGKGLDAASLTSLIKNAVKAYALDYDSPAIIMEKTNRLVVEETGDMTFATLFFAILEVESGVLHWTRAGHPAPVLIGKASCEFLANGSPPIGAFADSRFSEHQCRLEPGDRILLYTDGVTEARQNGSLYGSARLVDTTKQLGRLKAIDMPEQIYESVKEFCGGRLSDDMALLVVGYEGLGGQATDGAGGQR